MKSLNEGLNLPRKRDLRERLIHAFNNVGIKPEIINIQTNTKRGGEAPNLDCYFHLETIVGKFVFRYYYNLTTHEIDSYWFDNSLTLTILGDSEEQIMNSLTRAEKETQLVKSTVTVILGVVKKIMANYG